MGMSHINHPFSEQHKEQHLLPHHKELQDPKEHCNSNLFVTVLMHWIVEINGCRDSIDFVILSTTQIVPKIWTRFPQSINPGVSDIEAVIRPDTLHSYACVHNYVGQ